MPREESSRRGAKRGKVKQTEKGLTAISWLRPQKFTFLSANAWYQSGNKAMQQHKAHQQLASESGEIINGGNAKGLNIVEVFYMLKGRVHTLAIVSLSQSDNLFVTSTWCT